MVLVYVACFVDQDEEHVSRFIVHLLNSVIPLKQILCALFSSLSLLHRFHGA